MSRKSRKSMTESLVYQDARKFKVSIIGDMTVGKTCLSLRFVNNTFTEIHKSTISDIETKALEIDGKRIVYQIWDTAGQERFRSLLPLYLKGIDGAVIVYDVTEKDTFSHVEYWVAEVRKYATDLTTLAVVGNKLDLAEYNPPRRQVTTEEAQSWCRFNDILFYETSAKTGKNVDELFLTLGRVILTKNAPQPDTMARTSSTIDVKSKKKKQCCA
ncbi:Vacuolar protein sorting-associated protein 21 [Mactra antiquata]